MEEPDRSSGDTGGDVVQGDKVINPEPPEPETPAEPEPEPEQGDDSPE